MPSSTTPCNGRTLRFDLDDSPYQQAVPILLNMAHLFAVPLDDKSVLIAKDNPENRQRFERQLQETIYIPGMTNEQMDEFGNVVKNVFDVKQITVNKSSGTLVIRAPQETLTYINLTLADLIDGGSEVMIELKLYAVDKTNERNIGAQLPAADRPLQRRQPRHRTSGERQSKPGQSGNRPGPYSARVQATSPSPSRSSPPVSFRARFSPTPSASSAAASRQTGITTNQNPAFNLSLTASDTHALNDIQLRVGDRQPATFRVGERYPITTATYSTASPAANLRARWSHHQRSQCGQPAQRRSRLSHHDPADSVRRSRSHLEGDAHRAEVRRHQHEDRAED